MIEIAIILAYVLASLATGLIAGVYQQRKFVAADAKHERDLAEWQERCAEIDRADEQRKAKQAKRNQEYEEAYRRGDITYDTYKSLAYSSADYHYYGRHPDKPTHPFQPRNRYDDACKPWSPVGMALVGFGFPYVYWVGLVVCGLGLAIHRAACAAWNGTEWLVKYSERAARPSEVKRAERRAKLEGEIKRLEQELEVA